MIIIDESNQYDARFHTFRQIEENLIDGIPEEPNKWEFALDDRVQFSTAQFMSDYECSVCNKTGNGWMRIGLRYRDEESSNELISLTSACCKCGVSMCANPSEAISQMLEILDEEEKSIISNSMWKKAANARSFWGQIGRNVYQVGPMKKNPSVYWASNPNGFLQENFNSLDAAKIRLMEPVKNALQEFRKKLLALYVTN